MSARKRLYISVALLLSFTLLGWIGYMVIEGMAPLQAAYMTVITISTVGYGETQVLSPLGRIYTMILIMFGVGSVSYAGISLITLLVSGELRVYRERMKMQKTINTLKGHDIVCGFGRMGNIVSTQLRESGKDLVVIDNNLDRITKIEKAGFLYVQGNAEDESTLQDAGISEAHSLIATLPRDSDNVYVTLTARYLEKDLLIISWSESKSSESKLIRAGANRVVCPHEIGASRISELVTRPNVVEFVDVFNRGVEMEIDDYLVTPGSHWDGKSLREAAIRQTADAIVVGVKKANGDTVFNPSADELLHAGETLIIIGRLGTSERLSSPH